MVFDLAQLEDKFLQDKNAYWKMYLGRTKRGNPAAKNMMEGEKDLNTSLDLLLKEIDRYPDGIIVLQTLSSPNAKQPIEYVVSWGKGGGIGSSRAAEQSSGGWEQMMQMWGFMQGFMEDRIRAAEDRISHRYEMQNMQQQIETLQQPSESSTMDYVERIAGMISGVNTPPMTPTPRTAIGTAGQQNQETAADPKSKKQIDLNRLFHTSRVIQQLYPQHSVNELLDKFALFCQQNKMQADVMVKTLMNGTEGHT